VTLTPASSTALNLIRGLSAQFVLVGHLLTYNEVNGFYGSHPIFLIQNFGVTIFFILSGFLITYSADSKNSLYGFKSFLLDRFSRIYIAYVPALIFVFSLDKIAVHSFGTFFYEGNTNYKNLLGNIFMLQDYPLLNYLPSAIDNPQPTISSLGSARPFWTIAKEWWIYLFFGLLYFGKNRLTTILWLPILLIVPFYSVIAGGNSLFLVWMLGVGIFYLLKHDVTRNGNYLFFAISLIIAALRLYVTKYDFYDLGFSVSLGAAFYFMLSFLQRISVPVTIVRTFGSFAEFISSYSFSLYLLHSTVVYLSMKLDIGIGKPLTMLLTFVVCNIVAYFFASVTEFKYHQFRNWLRGVLGWDNNNKLPQL